MAGNITDSSGDSVFQRIRRTNDVGSEYWSSRDLAAALGYADYRNFEQVLGKAKLACFNSGQRIEDHFGDVTEMIAIGKGGRRAVRVRKTIEELGGTMPENLPTGESIKKLEAKRKKEIGEPDGPA